MATNITDATSTAATYSASDKMKQTLGMNKDDFLKLFIAQLQYQDPLAPQDPSAMLSQLSQLTQVEQAYNTSATLEKMLAAQNSGLSMGAVSLIGKQVTADGDLIGFNGTDPATATYQSLVTLNDAKLSIMNSAGQAVRTVELGTINPGTETYSWDGRDDSGNLMSAGAYSFMVTGTNAAGQPYQAATATSGKADGVSFHNGVAYVSIGPVVIPFSDVVTVKEI